MKLNRHRVFNAIKRGIDQVYFFNTFQNTFKYKKVTKEWEKEKRKIAKNGLHNGKKTRIWVISITIDQYYYVTLKMKT